VVTSSEYAAMRQRLIGLAGKAETIAQ
jgi:hypothetical protein